jgi:hypothetical protein
VGIKDYVSRKNVIFTYNFRPINQDIALSWDSSMGKEKCYEIAYTLWSSVLAKARHFSLFQSVQIGSGEHSASFRMGTADSFP